MESDLVTADMIEATEFPQLSMKYGVRGVPMTIVNEKPGITGSVPEPAFLAKALAALESNLT